MCLPERTSSFAKKWDDTSWHVEGAHCTEITLPTHSWTKQKGIECHLRTTTIRSTLSSKFPSVVRTTQNRIKYYDSQLKLKWSFNICRCCSLFSHNIIAVVAPSSLDRHFAVIAGSYPSIGFSMPIQKCLSIIYLYICVCVLCDDCSSDDFSLLKHDGDDERAWWHSTIPIHAMFIYFQFSCELMVVYSHSQVSGFSGIYTHTHTE